MLCGMHSQPRYPRPLPDAVADSSARVLWPDASLAQATARMARAVLLLTIRLFTRRSGCRCASSGGGESDAGDENASRANGLATQDSSRVRQDDGARAAPVYRRTIRLLHHVACLELGYVIDIRTATEADWPEMFAHDVRAFGSPFGDEAADLLRRTLDLDRFVVARDTEDGSLVGVAGSFALTLTLPGGAQREVPGVSWVAVAPSHRRLGVLRMMLDELHARFVKAGAAVAILTASEGTIYNRFGYGTATFIDQVTIDRRTARLRNPAAGPMRTRAVEGDAVREQLEQLYRRWHAATPGSVSADAFWELFHADPEWDRWGGSARRYLVHPEGFATYRVDEKQRAQIEQIRALTAAAEVDLWQTVLGLDIFDEVTVDLPLDHPLREMVVDLRSVKVTARKDQLWLKFIDVPKALAARTYHHDADLVLGVDDVAYRLQIRDGVAVCAATTESPSVSLSGPTLAGLYLGATTPSTLARAGRIDGDFRALTVFCTERQPELGTPF